MDYWIGYYTIFCGIIHNVVGVIVPGLRKPLLDIFREGFLNKVDPHMDRYASIFFQVMGFWWMILGYILIQFNPSMEQLPNTVGVAFILLTAFTVAAIPKSGFWCFFIPGIWIILT